ncbi:MAG: endonuclease V [Methanobacterium sp.]
MYFYDLNTNLANIQNKLAEHVIKEDDFKELKNIGGVDVSFSKDNRAVAAAVLINLKDLEIIETIIREIELLFPYKPGFLGFREANAMVSTLNGLKRDYDSSYG